MPEAFDEFKQGQKGPIFGSASTETTGATLTVSGSPICTLYDADDAIVSGFSGLPVTDWDTDPLATVRVWFEFDTLTPVALAVGLYTLVFKFSTTGSDGLARTHEPGMRVWVRSPDA